VKRPDFRTLLRWSGPAMLVSALVLVRIFGDRWWPALPLLFGPRWPLGILLLTPLLAHRRVLARSTVRASIIALVAFAMVLDIRIPWRTLLPSGGGATHQIRVVTWNVQGGGPDVTTTAHMIAQMTPDLAVISECAPKTAEALGMLPGLTLYRSSDLCFLTAFPMVEWAPRHPGDFWRMAGSGAIARLVVMVHGTEVVLGGVHLETPRGALEALAKRAFFSFPGAAAENQAARDVESEVARMWIAPADEIRPVIVAGDFNLVVESAIYQRWWGDLGNAFSRRGAGLGWTKQTRFFGVRIDHVLAGNGIAIRGVEVGAEMGADHRPLIAELAIPAEVSAR
jgi:vancomycin resistance protein VanJ